MFSHEVNTGTSAEAEAGDTELGVTGRVFTPGNWYCPGICSVVIKQLIYYTKEWYCNAICV